MILVCLVPPGMIKVARQNQQTGPKPDFCNCLVIRYSGKCLCESHFYPSYQHKCHFLHNPITEYCLTQYSFIRLAIKLILMASQAAGDQTIPWISENVKIF